LGLGGGKFAFEVLLMIADVDLIFAHIDLKVADLDLKTADAHQMLTHDSMLTGTHGDDG